MRNEKRKRRWEYRIHDMVESMEHCQQFVIGYDLESFRKDERTFSAVCYKLALVGEAAKGVPSEVREKHPEIPWRSMAGLRDVYVHEYDVVVRPMVWDVVQQDLPPALSSLRKLLQDIGDGRE